MKTLQELLRPLSAGSIALLLLIDTAASHEETRAKYEASLDPAGSPRAPAGDLADDVSCLLTIELTDSGAGKPISGLVRASSSPGEFLSLPGLFDRGLSLPEEGRKKRWHVLLERSEVRVPRKVLTLEAFRGLETALAVTRIDLSGKERAELTIPLRRIYDASAKDRIGGNTHLHLMRLTREQADEYLRSIPRADALDLVFVSHLERFEDDRTYISNTYTDADLEAFSGHGVRFGNGEEHRHNFTPYGEGYGHVMFLNIKRLIQPVSIGPGITKRGTDGLPLRRGILQAKKDGATTIFCHNRFGLEDIPDWVAGILDAQNIFDGGDHGSYDETFYRYLNIGLRVPFSTGTDWFIYDFSRVYVELEGEPSVERWLEGLAAGRSYITNGTFLEFAVDGKRPGAVLDLEGPAKLRVRAHGIGRKDFGRLEIVRNGEVIRSQATERGERDASHRASLEFDIEVREPSWLALRVPVDGENELGQKLFAHTSPVYCDVGGKRVFKSDVARFLVEEMKESIGTIEEKAKFADDGEKEAVLEVYREGIRKLEARLITRPIGSKR